METSIKNRMRGNPPSEDETGLESPYKKMRASRNKTPESKQNWQLEKNLQWDREVLIKVLQLINPAKADSWRWKDTGLVVQGDADEIFSVGTLDFLLLTRLQEKHSGKGRPDLQYFMMCWKQARGIDQILESDNMRLNMLVSEEHKSLTRDHICRCLSNAAAVCLSPDQGMGDYEENSQIFLKYITADTQQRAFPEGFLQDLLTSLNEYAEEMDDVAIFEDFINLIVKTVVRPANQTFKLSREAASYCPPSAYANVRPLLFGIAKLATSKKFATMLFEHKNWKPSGNGAKSGIAFEAQSIFMSFVSSNPQNWQNDPYFKEVFNVDGSKGSRHNAIKKSQSLVNESQDLLARIAMGFLKASPVIRGQFSDYLVCVLQLNKHRQKYVMPRNLVSNEATMANIAWILMHITMPIFKKRKKRNIQTEYFLSKSAPSFFWKQARLRAKKEDLADYAEKFQANNLKYSFATKIFAITLFGLHIGPIRTIQVIDRNYQHQHQIEHILNRRTNPPPRLIQRKKHIRTEAMVFCAILNNNPRMIRELAEFYSCTITWLLNLAKKGQEELATIPIFIVEDICKAFKTLLMIVNTAPKSSPEYQAANCFNRGLLLDFVMTFIRTDQHITSIHLRGELLKLLASYVPKDGQARENHSFNTVPFCRQDMVPICLLLYAEIENCGQGMFYEKHRFRNSISSVLKYLWKYEIHRKKLRQLWENKSSEKKVLEFLNMLFNDNIYLLDEALKQMAVVKETEDELKELENKPYSEERVANLREELSKTRGSAKYHNKMANNNITMVLHLSEIFPDPFLHPQIRRRMATMVDSYLKKLASKESKKERQALKAENFEQYDFKPKQLLMNIVKLFLNFCEDDRFIEAVASDEGFFSPGAYRDTVDLLEKKRNIGVTSDELERFKKSFYRILPKYEETQLTEAKLGDIPAEYQDDLMGSLMRDPVQLPDGSRMDRPYVIQMLMNKKENPFTRQPMTENDVKPLPELKQEIEHWIKTQLHGLSKDQSSDDLKLDIG